MDAPARVSYDPAASNQPRATQSRRIRRVLRQRGNSPGSSQRVIHLQHLGHSWAGARPRGLETFLRLAVLLQQGQALSTASQSPERAAVRGGDGATMRQIARGSGRARTRPMRGAPARGSASQLLSSRSCKGDRGFWLKLPRISLARSSQLRRGRSWEPGGKGWDSRQKGRMRMKVAKVETLGLLEKEEGG